MIVSLSVSLLWLLALLASAVHVRDGGRTRANALRVLVAFGLVVLVAGWFSPQPNWVAVLLALGAVWRLIVGPMARAGGVLAGASAGLAAALQVAGGVALWLAVAVRAVALGLAFLSAGKAARGGVPGKVLVAVALAIPPVGLANDLLFGWHSATMLRDAGKIATPVPPAWALGIVGLALAAGLLRGIWIRR
jgi:hypothetical protein